MKSIPFYPFDVNKKSRSTPILKIGVLQPFYQNFYYIALKTSMSITPGRPKKAAKEMVRRLMPMPIPVKTETTLTIVRPARP